MVFMIIIPFLNGYFIGNIPYFQTNPFMGYFIFAGNGIISESPKNQAGGQPKKKSSSNDGIYSTVWVASLKGWLLLGMEKTWAKTVRMMF